MKDTKEIKEAKKETSLLDEILCDRRLMNELHALDVDDSEVGKYLPLLATYLDQRAAEEDPRHELVAPYPGMTMKLCIDDSGKLSYVLGPNEETKRKQAIENNFIYRDYPKSWADLSFETLKALRFFQVRVALRKTLDKNSPKPWVFVKGKSGSGKSYCFAAYLNQMASAGRLVCFINGARRFDELRNLAIKNRDEFDRIMSLLQKCDLMVIDDFGNEFKSEYVRDQILFPILSERSRARLGTFFTSQYSLEDIKRLYSIHNSYIEGAKISNLIEKNIDRVITLEPGIETVSQKRAK